MKPKLPRALLWTEIESMEEFLKEPVNQEMYDLFLKIRQGTPLLFYTDYSVIKIFNEAYYQCTRLVYEEDPNILINDYIIDIKTNIGSNNQSYVVYYLIFFLLSHSNKESTVLMKYSLSFYKRFIMIVGKPLRELFEPEYNIQAYDIDFSPKPCATSTLNQMLIDWVEVTNHFDKESIELIVNLYEEVTERKKVYSMIEHAYESFIQKQGKPISTLKAVYPNMADYQFFFDFNEVKGKAVSEQNFYTREAEPRVYPTYQELEKENANLKKKLDEALLANDSLKSTLNMSKPKKQQETSFTVSMIVNYCKNIPDYSHAAPIEKMLYRYIKKCSAKEEKLIDSISEHFNNKHFGDTIMGDKNVFRDSSGLNRITLPEGMTHQEAIKLLQNKIKEDGEEG